MLDHHRATIERAVAALRDRDDPLAILVGGSIAHGFETPSSDVDLMVVVSDDDYRRRVEVADVTYLDFDSATYTGGYVDGKYFSVDLIRTVAERGNEPTRFAFRDAIVAWSRLPGLEDLIRAAARYPLAEKDEKLRKFRAQLEAWHWYCGEAFRLGSPYVLSHAVPNLVLFAGRLILAHNEVLYPYHKWFLRVLAGVEHKPEGLLATIDEVVAHRDTGSIEELYRSVSDFADWPGRDVNWGAHFLLDTELAWVEGRAAVGEI